MTGEQFVKLCFEEKQAALAEYFDITSESLISVKIQEMLEAGADKEQLFELINLILSENYYRLLMGIDGEASLGNTQMTYKLFDEEGNRLNECGEIEAAAYEYFMEEEE